MKKTRIASLVLALLLALSLTACGGAKAEDTVTVQSVAMLTGISLSGDLQFGGIVEAQSTVKVKKDASKTVGECYVKVGDNVKKGDKLFSYDTDALELSVSTAELEVEQLQNSISSYETQVKELEKEKKNASSSEKLNYTLQIQEANLNKSEAEFNLKKKQDEYNRLKEGMDETEVVSEADGIVQTVNEAATGNGESSEGGSDDENAFITIMQTGTYRVKGKASEELVRSLYSGMEMTVLSRTDPDQMWHGTIDEIKSGSADSDQNSNRYYGDDSSGDQSSKYAFYVALDSSDGLLIGQHVYIRAGDGSKPEGIALSDGFVVMDGENAYVWADNGKGKLEKRAVTLGEHNDETGEYMVTGGLTQDDYIAYPDDTLSEGMPTAKMDDSSFSDGMDEMSGGDMSGMDEMSGDMGGMDEMSGDMGGTDEMPGDMGGMEETVPEGEMTEGGEAAAADVQGG